MSILIFKFIFLIIIFNYSTNAMFILVFLHQIIAYQYLIFMFILISILIIFKNKDFYFNLAIKLVAFLIPISIYLLRFLVILIKKIFMIILLIII